MSHPACVVQWLVVASLKRRLTIQLRPEALQLPRCRNWYRRLLLELCEGVGGEEEERLPDVLLANCQVKESMKTNTTSRSPSAARQDQVYKQFFKAKRLCLRLFELRKLKIKHSNHVTIWQENIYILYTKRVLTWNSQGNRNQGNPRTT